MSEYEEDDGLSSFDLRQLGGKVGAFGGARLMKFVQGDFIAGDEKIGPEREFITFGLTKVVQKFVNKQLVDMEIIAPHDDFPDIEAKNEAAPRDEWGIGPDGKPQGPYSHLLILKLLVPESYDRYAFITKSMGGGVAVGDLSSKCKIARRIHGPDVTALVTCHSTRWPTKHNPHGKRPDFRVKQWVPLDGDKQLGPPTKSPKSIAAPMTESSTTSSSTSPASASQQSTPPTGMSPPTAPTSTPQPAMQPTTQPRTQSKSFSAADVPGMVVRPLPELTRVQEMDDEIPSDGNKG
jgi:cell division septation protein DedD